jgi:hypothetical protein
MRTHLAILRAAGWMVPYEQRAEWLREWRSELWYVCQSRGRGAVTAFCLGAFKDTLWLRRNCPCPEARKMSRLASPVKCLLFLVALAAISGFLAIRFPHRAFRGEPLIVGKVILLHLIMIALAVLILSGTTSLRLGEYPANSHSPPMATRLRRWIFFAVKIALIFQIVFCVSIGTMLIHGPVWVVYMLAFRWALNDQRQRCPVCLRSLAKPTRIGGPAQMFLEWYGTELMCEEGHGLLYAPEILTSCYNTQRWLYLDPSWHGLF